MTSLYQSGAFVEEFVRRTALEARKITNDYEIILVDDGSTDDSLPKVLELLKSNAHLKVIELSRNFGHHKALMTGLEHSNGDLIFLIDVDLEEPPELLADFYDTMKKGGWDVVYGVPQSRKGQIVKRLGGRLAWFLINALSPVKIPAHQGTVRLMTSQFAKELTRHKEHCTAIGGLWVITGFRQTKRLFDKTSRSQTSYSFLKRLRALLDSILSFSEAPLYGVFFMGCAVFLVSCAAVLFLTWQKMTGAVLEGWVSVMVSVWGLGGLILLGIGLVGLYISRIFIETKHRPYVIVRNIHAHGHR